MGLRERAGKNPRADGPGSLQDLTAVWEWVRDQETTTKSRLGIVSQNCHDRRAVCSRGRPAETELPHATVPSDAAREPSHGPRHTRGGAPERRPSVVIWRCLLRSFRDTKSGVYHGV